MDAKAKISENTVRLVTDIMRLDTVEFRELLGLVAGLAASRNIPVPVLSTAVAVANPSVQKRASSPPAKEGKAKKPRVAKATLNKPARSVIARGDGSPAKETLSVKPTNERKRARTEPSQPETDERQWRSRYGQLVGCFEKWDKSPEKVRGSLCGNDRARLLAILALHLKSFNKVWKEPSPIGDALQRELTPLVTKSITDAPLDEAATWLVQAAAASLARREVARKGDKVVADMERD